MKRQTALLLLLTASFGFAASRKISRDLAAVPADRQVDAIVIVWGDTGLAPNIVWGDHALLANNIVWANNIVCGDGTPLSEVVSIAINGER